jgi:preprotein translocase subunit SecD
MRKGIVAWTAIVAASLGISVGALAVIFVFRDTVTARLIEWLLPQPGPVVVIAVDLQQAVEQSIRVIERRFYDLAIRATIERQGPDRILVRLARSAPADKLIALATRRGRLEFRLIDTTMTAEEALAARPPPASEVLLDIQNVPNLVVKEAFVSGRDLASAHAAFSHRNQPVVRFSLGSDGTRIFGEVTQASVGKAFAIVFDGRVLAAPVIATPILGGTGEIDGSFTVEEAVQMTTLLRGGELPARLSVVEQHTPVQR